MTLEEQRMLMSMWYAYLGDESLAAFARNADMVSFYLDIVCESPLYRFGRSYEVFDVLLNGPFDPSSVSLEHYAERIDLKRSAA